MPQRGGDRLSEYAKMVVAVCAVIGALITSFGMGGQVAKAKTALVQAERDAAIVRALEKCMEAALPAPSAGSAKPKSTPKLPPGARPPVSTPPPIIAPMRIRATDFLDMLAKENGWRGPERN